MGVIASFSFLKYYYGGTSRQKDPSRMSVLVSISEIRFSNRRYLQLETIILDTFLSIKSQLVTIRRDIMLMNAMPQEINAASRFEPTTFAYSVVTLDHMTTTLPFVANLRDPSFQRFQYGALIFFFPHTKNGLYTTRVWIIIKQSCSVHRIRARHGYLHQHEWIQNTNTSSCHTTQIIIERLITKQRIQGKDHQEND